MLPVPRILPFLDGPDKQNKVAASTQQKNQLRIEQESPYMGNKYSIIYEKNYLFSSNASWHPIHRAAFG